MSEWIVLIWMVTGTGFKSALPPESMVFISTDTATFTEQWNRLGEEERKTSRIFKGKEFTVGAQLVPKPRQYTYRGFYVGQKIVRKRDGVKDQVQLLPGMAEYDARGFVRPGDGFISKENSWEFIEDWEPSTE